MVTPMSTTGVEDAHGVQVPAVSSVGCPTV